MVDHDDDEEIAQRSEKRRKLSASSLDLSLDEMNVRHKLWMDRSSQNTATWRPRRQHHKGAKHWCQGIDTFIRTIGPMDAHGLVWVKFDKDAPLWAEANWRLWPSVAIARDRGYHIS
jgi:hypothetical protein